MPQIRAAYKSIRKDKKRNLRNKIKMSELRTLLKKVRALISAKNVKEAEPAMRTLESKLCKAAKTNTIKKGAAARTVSRLKQQLHQIQTVKK